MTLKYNGSGEWIPGIPAQDLSEQDLDRFVENGLFDSVQHAIDELTSRGLYSVPKPKAKAQPKPSDSEDDN